MANKIYVGVSNKARAVKEVYVGVSSKARRVLKVYVGVNNVARLAYSASTISIPTMTSNSAPSGTASSSSVYSDNSSYAAWKAFDKSSSTSWQSKIYSNDNDRWLKYDFGFSVIPTNITVTQDSSYEHELVLYILVFLYNV